MKTRETARNRKWSKKHKLNNSQDGSTSLEPSQNKRRLAPGKRQAEHPYYMHNTSNLDIIDSVDPSGKGQKFTAKVHIAKKSTPNLLIETRQDKTPNRYHNIWYLKSNNHDELDIIDVVAQELFRLFIPGHPKARLVKKNFHLSLISKGVKGFKLLSAIAPDTLYKNIKNGNWYGLGEVSVIAMLLQETDLKLSNLGVDDDNRIIKIDGGCCFFSLDDKGSNKDNHFEISSADIRFLPACTRGNSQGTKYHPHNWIHDTDHRLTTLSNHQAIRHEINQALLRVCIMPLAIATKCIHDCIPENITQVMKRHDLQRLLSNLISTFDKSQKQLSSAALDNASFHTYVKSPEAKTDLESYIAYLTGFRTVSKRGFNMNDFSSSILSGLNDLKKNIRSEYTTKSAARLFDNSAKDSTDQHSGSSPNKRA